LGKLTQHVDNKQKLCRFTISNIRDPKQEFVTYELVPSLSKRGELILNKEKELHSEMSGYKVREAEFFDLGKNVNEIRGREINRVEEQRRSLTSSAQKTTNKDLKGHLQKLELLSNDLVQLEGVKSLIFADKTGRVIYHDARKDQDEDDGLSTFRNDPAKIWTLAETAYSFLKAAQTYDSGLSETQFIVIGRKDFTAVYLPIQPLEVVLRIRIDKNQDTRAISDQARSLIAKHLPQA
jgi:hypothetical protein